LCEWLTKSEKSRTLLCEDNSNKERTTMREKAPMLTIMLPRGDNTMKGLAVIQRALMRSGPAPQLSESELVTIALPQERISEPRENLVFRLHQSSLHVFFPGLKERSRSTRRTRYLWSVILAVRVRVQIVLDAWQWEETAAIDSAPVPCVGSKRSIRASDVLGMAASGIWSSKALKDCGCTQRRVVGLSGITLGFLLTPATWYDTQPVLVLVCGAK
jgi:hypothetical protein